VNPSKSTYDVVVVGAGIVGAACAYFLMKEGLRVAVLERGVVADGATGAAMGHLVAMDDSPAQLALTKLSLQLWKELVPELPPSAEYKQAGTLWIASDDEEMAEVRRKYEVYRSVGLACEILDSAALAEAEPKLRRPLAGALRVLGDGVIYPQAAAEFLLRGVAEHGALFTGCNVASIDGSMVLLGDGTRISAGYIVNAAGCAATELTPGIVMRKRKGHLIMTDRYPGFLRHQVVESLSGIVPGRESAARPGSSLPPSRDCRQREGEHRTLAWLADYAHFASMRLDDGPADRQAHTGPCGSLAMRS
jgi:glycine/D-amino acid oxidase-like deaminating enzyme